jgi:hypothetical protein
MQIIPFTSDPFQGFTVPLGDARYTFDVRYNETGVWTFDLTRESDGAMLLSSVPILLGQDILEPYALGLGGLMAVDLGGETLDAGADDMGVRVVVGWFSTEELAALRDAGVIL